MKNISLLVSEILGEQGVISKEDIDVCRYGLEFFITSFLEILSVLFISLFLKNFMYTLLFFISFVPLRIYAGGYHADTKLRCYIILLVVYACFAVLVEYISTDYILPTELISILFTTCMILLFAPIVHENKSVGKTEKEMYRKVCISIMIIENFIILVGGIFPHNKLLFSFSLGQLAVSLSMVAAFVKTKRMGGESNEKN